MSRKIAFIGAGAMGSILGSYLTKGGAEVWFVDPLREHMDAVRENGVTMVDENGQPEEVVRGMHTSYTTAGVPQMDAAVTMLNSNLSQIAIAEAKELCGPDTVLISFQNGLGHAEELAQAVPPSRVMYGTLLVSGQYLAPGRVRSIPSIATNVHIGMLEENPVTREMADYLVECFRRGGLTAEYNEDIDAKVWEKVILNCLCNATTAVTRLSMGGVYFDQAGNGRRMMEEVAREAAAVAHAKGIAFDVETWLAEFIPAHMAKSGAHFPSMAQDLFMRRTRTEIDWLNGKVAEYGRELGIPTPFNDVITVIIRTIQDNLDKQYRE